MDSLEEADPQEEVYPSGVDHQEEVDHLEESQGPWVHHKETEAATSWWETHLSHSQETG